ncbi:MAG: FHA domain-containing protein [Prevotella sp.]|nr:FHA domain-containing protein [Prevotella sp.]
MNNLRGRTILVGKEPQNGRLLISININGKPVKGVLGAQNSVPQSVSRCKPEENIAHCKIDVDVNGKMKVQNLKSQNVTYVNGLEIATKAVKIGDNLQMGIDRYSIPIATIMETASKMVDKVIPPSSKEFSIKPLEMVWDNYNKQMISIKKRNSEIATAASFAMLFTIGSGALSGVLRVLEFEEISNITIILPVIGLILMVRNYFRKRNDTSIEDMEHLNAELQTLYVCPNPACRHFLGNKSYRVLRQDNGCPYCKCKFTKD